VTYDDLVAGWKALRARCAGLVVRELAVVRAPRTMLVAELVPDGGAVAGRPTIALASGVHGDEPAGPWALLSIVADGLLDARFSYRIWPCTNPSGYRAGTRENAEGNDINRSFSRGGTTPEARAVITANRDRKFVLSLDLHEDFEADGFYCYEPRAEGLDALGPKVIRALDDVALPVQEFDAGFDLVYSSEERAHHPTERGRVVTDSRADARFPDGLPYNVFLLRHAARQVLTFESPRKRPWEERLAIHRVAVTSAIAALADATQTATVSATNGTT